MTAFEAQRPSGWLHCGEEDGQLMAGVVRSRTASSWQRNSQKATVPQRRLQGSSDAHSGSSPAGDLLILPDRPIVMYGTRWSQATGVCPWQCDSRLCCAARRVTDHGRDNPAMPETLLLFDRPEAVAPWSVIDDRVMVGVSCSALRFDPAGHAVFSGQVTPDNNGGIASVRASVLRCRQGRSTPLSLSCAGTADATN